MSREFAHTVLHKQNALNKPAVQPPPPPKEQPKPPQKIQVNPVPPAGVPPVNNKPQQNYHYQQKNPAQEERERRAQAYYEKLRKQADAPQIPKKEPKLKPPEPVPLIPKPVPQEKKVIKNPSVGAIINKPESARKSKHEIFEKPRPISRPAEEHKKAPPPPSKFEEKPKPKHAPPVIHNKPKPNFYVPDYKPFKPEEPAAPVGVMVIPPEKKIDKKPPISAEQKKKIEAMKEKAKREELEKQQQIEEQKKREEERNDRIKKREEDRIKMKAEIEKLKKNSKKSGDVGFCLVQNFIPSEEHRNKDDAVIILPKKEDPIEIKKDIRKNKTPTREHFDKEKAKNNFANNNNNGAEQNFVIEKKPRAKVLEDCVIPIKPKLENIELQKNENKPIEILTPVEISEEKREDIKDCEEPANNAMQTGKFGGILEMKKEEKPEVNPKTIRQQVEILTKSLISRQRARLKDEEQLEKDMQKLAEEYKEVFWQFF